MSRAAGECARPAKASQRQRDARRNLRQQLGRATLACLGEGQQSQNDWEREAIVQATLDVQ
jgi:hypothetical protein